MIHESIQQYITQIARHSSRVLRVALDRYKSKIPIHIISTYAPHNGHAEAERRQHCGEVKEILNKTCKRHMVIWCTDSNGKLGKGGEEEGGKTAQNNAIYNIRGPVSSATRTEKGNGIRLQKICRKQK